MSLAAWLKFTGPLILISVLLFALGVVAAWNAQRQQVVTSEVIAQEVASMVIEQDLYINMREVRYRIGQYLRTGDHAPLAPIAGLCDETIRLLSEAEHSARTAEEEAAVERIAAGFHRFLSQYQAAVSDGIDHSDTTVLSHLVDSVLTDDVLEPTKDAVAYNRAVVDRTNAANRVTTDLMRQGFLLLGLTGGAGGLIFGLTLAKALQRIILQLNVSVSGVAGSLEQVVGPVPISRNRGFYDIRVALQEVEQHIAQVVERLRQRELEVLRNEQLAAIGQLAAGMAHELRNPLTPMKMLVQSALAKGSEAAVSGKQLQVLAEEITRLETSIQNLLDFARPTALKLESVDLVNPIQRTLALVEARARQQGVQLVQSMPDQCLLHGDEMHLRQVLLNLYLNALDELPHGGRITLSVTRDTAARAWTIVIADTGPGIASQALTHIFEPFATSKETGSGLGLAICKRIIESHGGTIRADNSAEGGARFTIQLPCDEILRPPDR